MVIARRGFIQALQWSGRAEREKLNEPVLERLPGIGGQVDGSATMKAIRMKIQAATKRPQVLSRSLDLPLSHGQAAAGSRGQREAGQSGRARTGAGHLPLGLSDERIQGRPASRAGWGWRPRLLAAGFGGVRSAANAFRRR